MLALHRIPTTPAAPLVSSDELFALARVLDDVVQARETGCQPHYPLLALRLLEEDLMRRAAEATLDELLLARAAASSLRRPRRWALGRRSG